MPIPRFLEIKKECLWGRLGASGWTLLKTASTPPLLQGFRQVLRLDAGKKSWSLTHHFLILDRALRRLERGVSLSLEDTKMTVRSIRKPCIQRISDFRPLSVDLGFSFTFTGSGGRDLKGPISTLSVKPLFARLTLLLPLPTTGTKANPKNLRTAPQSSDQEFTGVNQALKVQLFRPIAEGRG